MSSLLLVGLSPEAIVVDLRHRPAADRIADWRRRGFDRSVVERDGREVRLSATERDLLVFLASRPGRTVRRGDRVLPRGGGAARAAQRAPAPGLVPRQPRQRARPHGAAADRDARFEELRAAFDEALTVHRGAGSRRGEATVLLNLADLCQRAALTSCSVFEGGFSLAAAERVVSLDAWPRAPRLLDVLQLLCDKSLVHAWLPEGGDELRFGLYPAIASFAGERLDAMGRRAEVEARHRAWALDVFRGGHAAGEAANVRIAAERALAAGLPEADELFGAG